MRAPHIAPAAALTATAWVLAAAMAPAAAAVNTETGETAANPRSAPHPANARHADHTEPADGFRFSIAPSTVAAGGRVTLNATGCRGDTRVDSGVFDPVTVHEGERVATARVDTDARQGAVYTVTFRCDHQEPGTAELTIAGGGRPQPVTPPADHGVRAGAGGAAGGFDGGRLGLGAVLVAGALLTAHRWSRARS